MTFFNEEAIGSAKPNTRRAGTCLHLNVKQTSELNFGGTWTLHGCPYLARTNAKLFVL